MISECAVIPSGAYRTTGLNNDRPQIGFSKTVTERGFVHQCTDKEALDATLSEGQPKTCYIGFDCTANSLHVGSLLPIMLLRWFRDLAISRLS